MFHVRRAIVLTALLALGSLVVMTPSRAPAEPNDQFGIAVRLLLLPLVATAGGIARGRYWSRWMALAAAFAVLPWAAILVLTQATGAVRIRAAIALIASLLLLLSLLGRSMFDRYEGSLGPMDWGGYRMSLVRWTIVFNLASLLNLYLFVTAYRYRIDWHILIPALALAGLLFGLVQLARQKTVGLVIVALTGLLFLPSGVYFVWMEAADRGEAALFTVLFLPGILAGAITLLAFGGPMYRYLRDVA